MPIPWSLWAWPMPAEFVGVVEEVVLVDVRVFNVAEEVIEATEDAIEDAIEDADVRSCVDVLEAILECDQPPRG
jgi:hypothetical protein